MAINKPKKNFGNPMDLVPVVHSLEVTEVSEIKSRALQAAKDELAERDRAAVFEHEKKMALRQLERERSVGTDEEIVKIYIDCAPHASTIKLDGFVYFQNRYYDVPVDVARVLLEQMNRTWVHEREIGGANVNFYQTHSSKVLSPREQHV
jgi:hypothetical protein